MYARLWIATNATHSRNDAVVKFSICLIMDCFGQSPRNDAVGCFVSLRGMSKANDEAIYNLKLK